MKPEYKMVTSGGGEVKPDTTSSDDDDLPFLGMIIADGYTEDEPVSYLTLLWIEQNINRVVNQYEVRCRVDKIKYEWEAQELIKEMEDNRLIPGLHFTPHKLSEMREYSKYLNDKDDKPKRTT